MKFIIDLIEDVREEIGNHEAYTLTVGLLKQDEENSNKLIYSGEALLGRMEIDTETRKLLLNIDKKEKSLSIGVLIPQLLILDIDTMMYEIQINVNTEHQNMEVLGFGKNNEAMRYILFIKI